MVTHPENYRVKDLVLSEEKVRIVFLLESPYKDEVVRGYPLAGRSGRNVSEFLVGRVDAFKAWCRSEPFGQQVKNRGFEKIALMNCSEFPLDKSVYTNEAKRYFGNKIEGWDFIRRNPKSKRRRDSNVSELEQELLDSLKERLTKVRDDALIIPCGHLARAFLEKIGFQPKNVIPVEIPHPSRRAWFYKTHCKNMKVFVEYVQKALG